MPNSQKIPTPTHGDKETMAAAENTYQSITGKTFNLISFRTLSVGFHSYSKDTGEEFLTVFKIIKWHMMVTH